MPTTANQRVGLALGVVYVLVGLLGFTVSGDHPAAGHEGGHLFGIFGVNALHNVVHLAVGVALAGAAMAGLAASRATNTLVGAVYALVGLVGIFAGDGPLNFLALNSPDHALHLGSALVLLAVGVTADKRAAVRV